MAKVLPTILSFVVQNVLMLQFLFHSAIPWFWIDTITGQTSFMCQLWYQWYIHPKNFPMVTQSCKITWELIVNLLVYHSSDGTFTHTFLVAFNSSLATWMLLTGERKNSWLNWWQPYRVCPRTQKLHLPPSCWWQYPLTQKPIWHSWDHTRVGGYRCVETDCEPFQQVYQHKSMATCSWSQSSQCFCGSRSLRSHIQIRGSEHLVLCYSARYQMLHCHRFMFNILQCSFTSFTALPLGKLSDTTQHIAWEHQEAIQKSPTPLTIKHMTFLGVAIYGHAWIPHYAYKT